MKTLVIFLKYLNYACKIKSSTTNLMRQLRYAWLENLFKSANQNILLSLDSFEKPYEKLELVCHRDIQTLENSEQKHSRFALVYSPLFSCVWISRGNNRSRCSYITYNAPTLHQYTHYLQLIQ